MPRRQLRNLRKNTDKIQIRKQERKEGMFRRGELPGRFMAKKLFGWMDKRYNQEYWGRLERNWNRWKESQWKKSQPGKRKTTLEMIEEEKEIKQENLGIREQTNEDDKMGNIADPYYEL